MVAGAGFYLNHWYHKPLTHTVPIVFKFERNTSLRALSEQLELAGVTDSATKFQYSIRAQRNYQKFQAGLYRFEGSVSPRDIVRKVTTGEIYEPVVAQLAIQEGATIRQVADKIQREAIGSRDEFIRLAMDPKTARTLGIPSKTVEGFLYPATYQFTEKPTLYEFLEKCVETFYKNLPQSYEARAKEKKLTLLQAVTFASLIELETAGPEERRLVSEVIWRRLNDNAPLGIDAAVIYGIKDYRGDIGWKHLRDNKNLYNTRIHRGLPPTPVGSPSKEALMAVLNPTNEGYYYYVVDVTTPGPPHKHKFSKTLQEHQKYVKLLVNKTKTSALDGQPRLREKTN
jgi:UPF0755 protein